MDSYPYILNCMPSTNVEEDWTYEDAVGAGVIEEQAELPDTVDLREDWWAVANQGKTGACVGFATAYGVLHWHYVKAGKISIHQVPSARFIWMANKETDELTRYPTTFLETAGTQTKLALNIARKYGCVLEEDLPMEGGLCRMTTAQFYTKAARLRISSYHNIGMNLSSWRKWLAFKGPLLARLNVDSTWISARNTGGYLEEYQHDKVIGGHAICIVGYDRDHFIVRNSWGSDWGDSGFAHASESYALEAFSDVYGAVM